MSVRTLLGRAVLVAISTSCALVALEIAFRLFGPPPPPPEDSLRTFTEYDPDLGWRGRPRARGPYRTRRFSIDVVLNSGGWRDEEPPSSAQDVTSPNDLGRRHRIAILGDSFAWGYGVQRGETFADRLEAALPGWTVQNYGISGYGTDQELLVLRRSALAIEPAVVIVEFAIGNDLDNILGSRAYHLPKPRFTLEGPEGTAGTTGAAGVTAATTEGTAPATAETTAATPRTIEGRTQARAETARTAEGVPRTAEGTPGTADGTARTADGTAQPPLGARPPDDRLRLTGVPVPRIENWDRPARTGVRDFLTAHVRLYAWARPRWANLRPGIGRLLRMAREDDGGVRLRLFSRSPSNRVREGWRLAEALLGAIQRDAQAAGARTVLLVVPDRFQVEQALWEQAVAEFHLDRDSYDRDLPDRTLAEIGARLGILVVDPLEALRERSSALPGPHKKAGETVFLPDDAHWNAAGHAIAAEALARALRPLLDGTEKFQGGTDP